MTAFMNGGSFVACAVIALVFYRFWRQTADRLFALFALAFVVFGVNRAILSALDENADGRVYVYVVRLLAFVLIIGAIAEKNRGSQRPR